MTYLRSSATGVALHVRASQIGEIMALCNPYSIDRPCEREVGVSQSILDVGCIRFHSPYGRLHWHIKHRVGRVMSDDLIGISSLPSVAPIESVSDRSLLRAQMCAGG